VRTPPKEFTDVDELTLDRLDWHNDRHLRCTLGCPPNAKPITTLTHGLSNKQEANTTAA